MFHPHLEVDLRASPPGLFDQPRDVRQCWLRSCRYRLLIINHDGPLPLFEGVETCMLVALSLLSFLGLRYPIKMLPILLFEISWKFIWLTVIAIPLLTADHVDPATLNVFYACLWVVIVLAVLPWRYVFRQYVVKKGDPWRPEATRPGSNQL